MILYTLLTTSKRLIAIKYKGRWRSASRYVGPLKIEYEVDTATKRLSASYGTALYGSLMFVSPFYVEDYLYYENT